MPESKNRFRGASELEWRGIFPSAPLRHVEQGARTAKRDRFGNRIFTSQERAYSDRENLKVKSALLVSERGQDMMRQHEGILQDISCGLEMLAPKREGDFLDLPDGPVLLGPNRWMQFLGSGAQSTAFRLAIGNERYAIKVHRPDADLYQPYINEMLQMQTLAVECADALAGLHVDLPRFFFASGQVSCTEYVPNPAQLDQSFDTRHYALAETLSACIQRQKDAGNTLWDNVYVDTMHDGKLPRSNYRQREDGTVVWIDPVAYFPDSDVAENATRIEYPNLIPPVLSWQEYRDHYATAKQEIADLHRLMQELENVPTATWLEKARPFFAHYAVSFSPSFTDDFVESHAYAAASIVKRIILEQHHIRWMMQRENKQCDKEHD